MYKTPIIHTKKRLSATGKRRALTTKGTDTQTASKAASMPIPRSPNTHAMVPTRLPYASLRVIASTKAALSGIVTPAPKLNGGTVAFRSGAARQSLREAKAVRRLMNNLSMSKIVLLMVLFPYLLELFQFHLS